MADTKMNGKKILIIEDEAPLRSALGDVLTLEGFTVFNAKDGQEGLDRALKENPDVIILDLIMPVMDGMTMLKILRNTKGYGETVPVIVLSNLGAFDERVSKGGVNTENPSFYLVKSNWSLEGIVNKVRTVIQNTERSKQYPPLHQEAI